MWTRAVYHTGVTLALLCLLLMVPSTTSLNTMGARPVSRDLAPLQEAPWPTDGWTYSSPEEQGMDNETLTNMMDFIAEHEYPIHSVLVVRNGYAVFERYPHEYYTANHLTLLHSVTKSFAGALIGIAIQQGLLGGVDEQVLGFFPEYDVANPDPRKDSMTIEDLLTMTPGLDWDESSSPYESGMGNTLIEMMESSDSVQYVLDRPMANTPGEHWVYNGGASVLLGAVVQQISNQTTYDFAREYLFEPLGIQYSTWYGLSGGWCNTMGGLRLMTRDIAKLGLLYLNNGTWNGTQILPSEYVANASRPIGLSNPLGPAFDYGWHWWIRSDLGIYFAYGRYGQKIMVAPEYNLVVAFTAYVPDDGYDPEFNLFRDYILRSISSGSETPITLFLGLSVTAVGVLVVAALVFRRLKKQ